MTQGTPQNQTDLLALFNALTGIQPSAPSKTEAGTEEEKNKCDLFIAAGLQSGTARLPFDAKITVAADSNHPNSKTLAESNPNDSGSSPRLAMPREGGNSAPVKLTTSGNDCTNTNCVALRGLDKVRAVTTTVSGTFTGTLVFEVPSDTAPGQFENAKASSDSKTDVSSTNTPGTWTILTGGKEKVQVRVSALTSGVPEAHYQQPRRLI